MPPNCGPARRAAAASRCTSGATRKSRRGRVQGVVLRGASQIIRSMVPLSEMFGYATELRSRTQGRGSFTMHFGRYEEVPAAISEEIISRVQGRVTRY